MKMLLQALKDEEEKSKNLSKNLTSLRANFQKRSDMESEAKIELAKQETKYILEMQKARQKSEEIRKELSEQLQKQRRYLISYISKVNVLTCVDFTKTGDAALKAVETSKNMVLERDKHREEAEAHRRKLDEEKRRTAKLSKLLESKQNESQLKDIESEKLKNELMMKDHQLREEMAKRAELLRRLTEFEKGVFTIYRPLVFLRHT